ncbi:MAG: ATP-dependent helicase, partial [Propionibacteriaceae bacterium]|nr:ATP-dependent helicase [Propionibacteriaceae bacterium]
DVELILDVLAEEGALHRSNGNYRWIGAGYPAGGLSLRTSTFDNVVIQDVGADASTGLGAGPPQVIGQMDRPSAPVLIHEGAVYLHGGATFVVESLDWDGGIARVRAAALDYYTRASSTTEVRVLEERQGDEETRRRGETARGYGEVLVTTWGPGYRKIKRYTHEVLAW